MPLSCLILAAEADAQCAPNEVPACRFWSFAREKYQIVEKYLKFYEFLVKKERRKQLHFFIKRCIILDV